MFCNKSVNEEWDIIEFLLNKIIEWDIVIYSFVIINGV